MADLVERLNCDCDSDDCTFKLAKDRIEQLKAEIARKDEALSTIIARCEALEDEACDGLDKGNKSESEFWRAQKITAKSLRRHLASLAALGEQS